MAALVAGTATSGDPAVVAVNDIRQVQCTRGGVPTCTGTVIAEDRVLTAAHCAERRTAASFGILLGDDADAGTGPLGEGVDLVEVTELIVHPDYDPTTYAWDLAVLVTAEPMGVEPVLVHDLPLDASFVGQSARVVGFGAHSDEATPFHKREGTVQISEVDGNELTYTPGPAMTCAGDSGGPVFAQIGNDEVLIGVTSRGDATCEVEGVAIDIGSAVDFLGAE